mgnify:CR=1 FL=1
MKFDKEYPATHSMETAWYAADEDGNVALIMYNDNGPVPENLPDVRIGEKYILFLSSIQMRHIQVMASLSLLRISYQIRTMFMRNLIGLMIHCRE